MIAETEIDARQCGTCHGDGWFWKRHHVNHGPEIGVEDVELREYCDLCEGLGWTGPDAQKAKEAS